MKRIPIEGRDRNANGDRKFELATTLNLRRSRRQLRKGGMQKAEEFASRRCGGGRRSSANVGVQKGDSPLKRRMKSRERPLVLKIPYSLIVRYPVEHCKGPKGIRDY